MDADALPAERVTPGPSVIAGRGLFAVAPHTVGDVVLGFAHEVTAAAEFGTLNHSCDPNLGWAGGWRLAARRDVAAGEELTVDYSTSIVDPSFVLWCHCGSTRCRQAVEGTDWQIPQLQARYAGWWAPSVQNRLADARPPRR